MDGSTKWRPRPASSSHFPSYLLCSYTHPDRAPQWLEKANERYISTLRGLDKNSWTYIIIPRFHGVERVESVQHGVDYCMFLRKELRHGVQHYKNICEHMPLLVFFADLKAIWKRRRKWSRRPPRLGASDLLPHRLRGFYPPPAEALPRRLVCAKT